MASSLYSNAQHVDFDSVLAMDDPAMVSMFEALEASGLRGFLGCPAIVYEDALVDFFENASVWNEVIFSTVDGQIVQISEKLFAESFELPVEGLEELSEMSKDAIFDARSIVSMTGEQINLSGRKNQMKMPYRLLCDIMAKAISVKAGSFNAITVEKFSLITAVVCGVKMNWAKYLFGILKKMVAAKTKQAKGFAIQICLLLATFPAVDLGEASAFLASKILSKKTVLRFVSINDRDGAEEIKEAAKKKDVSKKRTAADIDAAVPKKKRTSKKKSLSSISSLEMVVAEEALVVAPLDVEEPRCSSADAVDMIIQQWEAERPVVTASDTEDEDVATAVVAPADPVQQVEEIVVPLSAEEELSADETTSLDDILLSIPVDIPLPICADIDLLQRGSSFCAGEKLSLLRKLFRGNFYILLKYRTVLVFKFLDAWRINFAPGQGSTAVDIQVIELLSEIYISLLEELAKEARALNITWNKPCCSKIFEGSSGDQGAVIARTNNTTRSLCWIRRMFMVDGAWKVEQCADMWVKIPKKVESTVVLRQRQYDDTLPSMSVFFKLLRKRWADVCLEAVEFCVQSLLPVGSIRACRSLPLSASVSSFDSRRPTIFELRVSQFCSIFVDMSLFNRISRAEISEFLSAIALEKTVLRGVQSFEDSFSVAPRVQLALAQQQSTSSSSSSTSSLRFDATDIDATASSQPHISQDLSALFADFQANLSEQLFDSQSNISSKLHKIEQNVRDSLIDQDAVFKSLSQEARQENRTLDNVQTIRFNEFRKTV
ncbi:hypothetical protein F511_30513 [Dorcoceras hygrometricum]|uniref:Dystroglycan-like n=1 Tax=Dorcoceras hygrometricum TaxID=472368 RepID=A0A2Z7AI33_9LAMI|nr:hypothetical protein F511_30513 [Dorcoceras hygrometricum]